ncbi:hypothetical protein [Paeniglutamicibacter antarcticus]|uniref:DUF3618 domain-containing protein n=1 Tax=Paeniglutamicibacter antarcticus TaxID=494023 RepID=A0ABP9TIN4_9MICC
MNDINIDKQMETIQKQLKTWAKKAKADYPSALEDTVRQAVDRVDPAGIAKASEDVLATVTGNRKKARQARKSIESTLKRAQKKAGSKKSCASGTWVVLGSLAVIGIVAAIVVRRAANPETTATRPSEPHTGASDAKGVDPDIEK